jgi:hypothetical protein
VPENSLPQYESDDPQQYLDDAGFSANLAKKIAREFLRR